MKPNKFLASVIFLVVISASACTQTAVNNSAANNVPTNATANASNSAAMADTTTPPAAGSPTEAYIAAYNARKNKDIPKLRSLMAKDILEFLEIIGEEDKKSIDDMLKELAEKPQASKAETRNEKLNGNKATVEYLDEDGTWQTMDFVKEGDAWKLTLAAEDLEGPLPKKGDK